MVTVYVEYESNLYEYDVFDTHDQALEYLKSNEIEVTEVLEDDIYISPVGINIDVLTPLRDNDEVFEDCFNEVCDEVMED